MSNNRRMNKEMMSIIFHTMDYDYTTMKKNYFHVQHNEFQKHYTEWRRPDTKSTSVSLRLRNRQNSSTVAGVRTLVDSVGGRSAAKVQSNFLRW